jgi:hypothetical protein
MPAAAAQLPSNDLKAIYRVNMRQRFKAEINRLTSGAMAQMLDAQPMAAELSFPLSYLYSWHWLRQNVDANYRTDVLEAFSRGKQAFLMHMLLESNSTAQFIERYIQHWLNYHGEKQIQQQQLLALHRHCKNNTAGLQEFMLDAWNGLSLFGQSQRVAYHEIALVERNRYREVSGADEQQRLQLIDQLETSAPLPDRFDKLGLIPSMACPQTCRHCMFVWRPIMKDLPDPGDLMQTVNRLTRNVLFTGGDLTRQLDDFYRAIREMGRIQTFAILLNGDFADTPEVTRQVLESMAKAVRQRPANWPQAKIMLQISFDEFHQEVVVDKYGGLKERIPVHKIANIVELAPRYPNEIQLCLLHKQQALNFSMELFQKGVFARLAQELGRRGHQVQVLSAQPSSRQKRNPANNQMGQLIRDANFCLSSYPDVPILLTSSTIDSYGRAETLEPNEAVNDREILHQVLQGRVPEGEFFDNDLMFWFNGWVTLFSAVHICLGDFYRDGLETILHRWQTDPLSNALRVFDLRLLDYYREIRSDLDALISNATGPQQLFHAITESAEVRLHLTQRLIESA